MNNDPIWKQTSYLTCADALTTVGDCCVRPVSALIDGTNGDNVIPGLGGFGSCCRIHWQQNRKSERGRDPARHPVRCCRRLCRWLAIPHLRSPRGKWTQRLQPPRSGHRLSGFPGSLSHPETQKSLVAGLTAALAERSLMALRAYERQKIPRQVQILHFRPPADIRFKPIFNGYTAPTAKMLLWSIACSALSPILDFDNTDVAWH